MKRIVALSGGMDSTTVLSRVFKMTGPGEEIETVAFRYGSKHNLYENNAAMKVASFYGVPILLQDIGCVMENIESNLLSKGEDVPEGHYLEETMRQTVVPGRNLIFASVLAGIAWSQEYEEVWLGIHAGDHYIYPDCRPEFFTAMKEAVFRGTDGNVILVAPFLEMNKTDIIREGTVLGTPYELTRTCYKAQETACGRCGSCQERLEAFFHNDLADPIGYETRELLAKT